MLVQIKIIIERFEQHFLYITVFEFWFQIPSKTYTAQCLLRAAHIALDFTCVDCAAALTIFRTTDAYELGFSY